MLKHWADGLWTHEMAHVVAGFHLGARMTITRASTGALTIIAPIRIDEATRQEILALGPVRYIIAPNLMHYRFLPDAKQLFPQATVLAAPGLREKMPKLSIDAVLGQSPEHDRTIELDQLVVQGMTMFGDVVFHHAATSTLIVTDVFANFPAHDHWWTRGYLKLSGAYGKPAQTMLLKMVTKNRAALNASRDAMLKWNFDRIVVAHGVVIETGGKDALRIALPGQASAA